MTADGALGVALLGCGYIGSEHARALSRVPSARLVAAYDPVAARARELATRYGAAAVDSVEATLAHHDVAAAIVATPSETHRRLAEAAARAAKHVLLEKPAALSIPDLLAIQQACAEAGVVLLVAQTLRFGDLGRALRAAVVEGDLGRPVYCNLVVNSARPWPGGWRGWQTDPERSGGMALHLAIHTLDLALWLLGERPERVYAQGADLAAPGLAVHDYLHVLVRCAGGAQALVESHSSLRGAGNAYQSACLLGTRGQATWSSAEDGLLLADGGARLLFAGYAEAQRAEVAHFAACCLGQAQPLVTPEQARWSLATALAANRAIARGQPIEIEEVLGDG